jgi:acetamidase/formamidase
MTETDPMTNRRDFLAGAAAAATLPMIASLHAEEQTRPEIAALAAGHIGQYQGGVYLLPATDETVQWGWFDNAEAPRARIRPGDTLVMETMMASLNQVLPGVPVDEITRLRVNNPGRGPHTITGPVFVEGAMPGDVLKIHLNRIVPRAYGANWNLPGHLKLGQFPDAFAEPQVKYFFFDMKRGVTEFLPGIELPVRPFPGILGVARAESGRFSTVPPGPFGGNMDVRELIEGTTLYLPVFVDGALLWSGDSHAAQGNGEINLTAIETAFNELNMTIDVVKGAPIAWPRIETPTHWITVGYDRDLNRALDILEEETLRFVVDSRKLGPTAARQFIAAHGDCRVSEVVNQLKGVYCMLPKHPGKPLPARPMVATRHNFVTHATDGDAQNAMNDAALAMIHGLQERKGLSALDAYSLASLAMDARIGRLEPGARSIHCLLPTNLWVPKR